MIQLATDVENAFSMSCRENVVPLKCDGDVYNVRLGMEIVSFGILETNHK